MKRLVTLGVAAALAAASAVAGSPADVKTYGKRTAALPAAAWDCAEWISAQDAPVVTGKIEGSNMRAADGASWFTSTLRNSGRVLRARWMITSLGVFQPYVNGKPVGGEFLRPGFTHPEKTRRSFTYDITDVFNTAPGAENQLAAQVTPGWWADKIVTEWGTEGMRGHKTALRGVLELTYDDGTTARFGTDTGWQAAIAGPVRHAGIYDGEQYDARVPAGYTPSTAMKRAEKNTEFAGEILPSEGAEVYLRRDLTLHPVKAYIWQGGTGKTADAEGTVTVTREYTPGATMTLAPGETLVIDFGQNASAVPQFDFAGAEGVTLRCHTAELLNDGNGAHSRGMDGPEGSIHCRNLRLDDRFFNVAYTFADGRRTTYRPDCTFLGYRFASLTADGPVTIYSVNSVPVTSITRGLETGTIETGNDDINRLISNTVWGMRSNYLSVPTDCPQRDERLGWTADTQVFAETGTFFADTRDFFHKWTRDLRDSQSDKGGFPGVAPRGQYGGEMNRLGWADAGVIVPWTVWKQFGDTAIVNENWAAMDRFITHIDETRYDHHALSEENGDYQWADWLSYEPLESCSGRKDGTDAEGRSYVLPETYDYWNYLSACYWAMDADMMRDMARATGRNAGRFEKMAARARRHIRENFINADGTFRTPILNTMQTPALFALRNGVVDGAARQTMIERLRSNFAEHGNCLQTGFLGTLILMNTLTENGMADLAYELLFQHKNPSWLYSVDNGATTIWERWNSYMIENGMGPSGMNSFNHYAYGCVCEWMWKTMAGIAADPADPGFRHIIMKPVPDRRLGHVKAEYNSAAGTIRSEWRYDGPQWTWQFTIPDGAKASVTLPGSSEPRTYPSGTHTVTLDL